MLRFSAEIAGGEPERPDYLHSVLCQVGLPRSATSATKFKRTNGSASLLVEAGSLWDGSDWIEQPLPYGTRHGWRWSTSAARPSGPDAPPSSSAAASVTSCDG